MALICHEHRPPMPPDMAGSARRVDHLKTSDQTAADLTQALKTGDISLDGATIDTAGRAKGMAKVAKDRPSPRKPANSSSANTKRKFETIAKVIHSFDVKLVAQPTEDEQEVA